MADELDNAGSARAEDKGGVGPAADERTLDKLDEVGRKAVKVAASTVIATTLVGALAEPPHAEMMTLPEPTPIVQVYQAYDDDVTPDDDETEDEQKSRWKTILRMLRYLLIAAALIAGIVLGTLKGCAGIAGGLLLPPEDEQEEQPQAPKTQTEDERGVALAG